jgi:hypothetical protein
MPNWEKNEAFRRDSVYRIYVYSWIMSEESEVVRHNVRIWCSWFVDIFILGGCRNFDIYIYLFITLSELCSQSRFSCDI